ncbi:hypothetical protein P8C59_001446 [Phyllachora maydis]|uniref:Phosphatidylinositol-specific phospholipase C X domain-containing protein n=1 Tax=Phyllachora maydis TaxID=1825666 RepID=A0AAD9HY88_9PEZI|nr:hypothetical protein P8C59_001446 [Phyllachora maydis]
MSSSSSSWLPHGLSSSGFLTSANQGQSRTVPAVAVHRGRLWCLWADHQGKSWSAATTVDGQFGPRSAFPQAGLPVMANLNGHLHAVIVLDTGTMLHFLYDHLEEGGQEAAWDCLGPLDATEGRRLVAHASSPSLATFHNSLFLVYLHDAKLYTVFWSNSASNPTGHWSAPVAVAQESTFAGIPALFVLDGVLHLLCATDTESREILGYRYDHVRITWEQCHDVSEGRAARGVSATSYGDKAYLAFLESGPGDESHSVSIASYQDGEWQPHEAVDGQAAADPPQIAILNGRIHCIFNDKTPTRDLRWYSRPVLGYSLSCWMASVPDATLLSDMTIPGTHDSCARSNIPFVRTQYLDITHQLALGIRFFDLRLRRHEDDDDDDGRLYCYHGGIPIDMPRGLPFASVMHDIWAFLGGPRADAPPTETVLVSIKNDDASAAQRAQPAVFYRAVEQALAATVAYADGRRRWFAEPVTPRLGDVRGRAVLLRRYPRDPHVDPRAGHGLDLSGWLDDNPDFTLLTPTHVRVHIQDKWKFAHRVALRDLVAAKSAFVQSMIRRAAGARADEWYFNFCSAVGDPVEHGEIAEAKWIAVGAHSGLVGRWVHGMNVLTRDLVPRSAGKKRLGVVPLDYPELPEDNDLVARLIETNF